MTHTATTPTASAPAIAIGPADHGRRMTLDEFETARASEGRMYELSRGVVIVTDVPNPPHFKQVEKVRVAFDRYRADRPGVIAYVLPGSECKLLIEPTQSERHPDLAVYKTRPPLDDSTVWSIWVPELVVEVVSPDSGERDYVEKPEDYLLFGVLEYWVVDPFKAVVTVYRRVGGRWRVQALKAGDRYTTPLLPGFDLDVAAVLQP
jgi:Uma2 family endonuclease